MGTELKHITFSIDGPADKFDYIEDLVRAHGIEEYLISHELVCDKNIPHYHFIILTNEKVYANFIKKLRNDLGAYKKTTGRGGYCPYQRLKKPIDSLQRLKIYCTKEGNIRSTYSAEVLKDLHDHSFMKEDKDKFKKLLIATLDEEGDFLQGYDLKERLYKRIINIMITEDMKVSRPGVISWANYYIAKTTRIQNPEKRANTIYNLLF